MTTPIVCGEEATSLSEVVQYEDVGWGVYMWVVADVSAPVASRDEAFAIARAWFPNLIDDEAE